MGYTSDSAELGERVASALLSENTQAGVARETIAYRALGPVALGRGYPGRAGLVDHSLPSPLAFLADVASRPRRTCGLHGDDTTSGRCASCDAESRPSCAGRAAVAHERTPMVADGVWRCPVCGETVDG